MAEFILTGFGDEIDASLDIQMDVLDKLGIHYIETRGIDGKNIADYTPAEAKAVHARMQARGFGVSALGSPIGKIDIRDPFAPHLDSFRNLLDVAHAMETKYIRLFSFFLPEGEDPKIFRDEVLERMGRFVEAARGSGIQLLHENEKHIYGDVPERCLEIFQAYPEILCTYDPSNFVQCGVRNREAFQLLRPYVRYLHVKDSLYTDKEAALDKGFDTVSDAHRPAGQGDGELPWILGQLKEMDYHGFASIEPHLSGGDFVPGTGADKFTAAANALKGLLEAL
ncbi:MAG: sugar phosphate isomerase/epimerase family protein [Candidatus Spyradocola sp.]|jgi:L-ribulose-5-phosphate 3-epimerase